MEPINTSNTDEECLLGGQTLALSDSENENYNDESKEIVANCTENDASISKDVSPIVGNEVNSKYETNECKNLLLNDDQRNLNSEGHTDDIHLRNMTNENKFDDQPTKIINGSTSSQVVEITTNYLENSLNYNFDSDSENKICPKKSKRISYSDDEEDIIKEIDDNQKNENQISVNADNNVQKNKKISTIIDSESEEEICLSAEENNEKELVIKYNQNTNTSNSEIEQKSKKISAIIDSESDEEELHLNDEENYNSEEYANIQTGYDIKPRKQRASAKIALDTISAIKSETQRMHRENQINVPYHKPRNCTLKEFMARKSQEVLTKTIGKGLSLKMSEEELENYVKYLEKREQESQELFANESIIPEFITTIKEDKEQNECAVVINTDSGQNDIINNDNVQNETGESSKIEIISNILIKSPIITFEPPVTPTLNITNLRKLISEDKYRIASPTLQGDSKFVIDLESGDMIPSTLELTPRSGVDKLFERFLKSSGCKKRNNATINSPIISDNESTNLLNCNNSLLDESKLNNNIKDRKPGASYVALKNNLRKIIFESRKIVLDKKINDFKIENKIVEQICAEEDEEDDYVSQCYDEENQDIEKDNYKIDENSDYENIGEDILKNEEEDNENEEIEDADDESDDSTNNENIRNKKLSHRVIKRFEDDSDSDNSQENNFLNMSTQESNEIEITEKQEDELLELCSGKFDLTQQQSETAVTGFVIPTTQLATQFNESQLEALCSGTFTDKVQESVNIGLVSDEVELFKKPHERSHNTKTTANKILYSDDEDEEKNNVITNFNAKINTKNSTDDDENEEEQVETFIDYDSDENEIHVEMTKNDRKMKANDFVEKEAELSESEWGSADEDEKDLDRYDIELGDEDQFDQEKLQSELGKIHMRKMLDEDAREVKKMQELLLEDEENDGLGRQRQFRWRKTENGFDINNDNGDGNQENKGSGGEDDDESEEQWRKMKHEREILLLEKQTTEGDKIILSPLKLNNSNEIGKTISSPKFSISKLKKRCIDLNKNEIESPFLISKNNSIGIRGSFLKRDQEILSKVAANLISSKEMNNNIDSDSNDNIGRVKTTTGKYKNFVFTILSQPAQPQQTNKRKLSDSSYIDKNKSIKKSKFIPSHENKKNLIDHLDLTEI